MSQNRLWWWVRSSVNILTNTEFYTLNLWIARCVNYTSIKLFTITKEGGMSASWWHECTPLSPLQSTTSKTSATQRRCPWPTHQHAGECHTSVHLEVGGLGKQQRPCPRAWLPSWGPAPTAPEKQAAAHTTLASWLQQGPRPQGTGSSGRGASDLSPCSHGGTRDASLPDRSSDTREPDNPRLGRGVHSPGSHPLLSLWCPWPRQPWTQWRLPPSQCPYGNTSDSSKAPATPEAQGAKTRAPGKSLAESVENGKCRFSNTTKGSSGERNQKKKLWYSATYWKPKERKPSNYQPIELLESSKKSFT